jgi:hypothetical protein
VVPWVPPRRCVYSPWGALRMGTAILLNSRMPIVFLAWGLEQPVLGGERTLRQKRLSGPGWEHSQHCCLSMSMMTRKTSLQRCDFRHICDWLSVFYFSRDHRWGLTLNSTSFLIGTTTKTQVVKFRSERAWELHDAEWARPGDVGTCRVLQSTCRHESASQNIHSTEIIFIA